MGKAVKAGMEFRLPANNRKAGVNPTQPVDSIVGESGRNFTFTGANKKDLLPGSTFFFRGCNRGSQG